MMWKKKQRKRYESVVPPPKTTGPPAPILPSTNEPPEEIQGRNIIQYKVAKKDAYELAFEKFSHENLWKNTGLEKMYVLGQLSVFRGLLGIVDKPQTFSKEDIVAIAKASFSDYEWMKELVDALNSSE